MADSGTLSERAHRPIESPDVEIRHAANISSAVTWRRADCAVRRSLFHMRLQPCCLVTAGHLKSSCAHCPDSISELSDN